jgi:hypothetical protein
MFYIAFIEGYDDPMALVGPFPSFDAAVDAHFQRAVEAGAVAPGGNPHDYYLHDDAVRIGVLSQEVK